MTSEEQDIDATKFIQAFHSEYLDAAGALLALIRLPHGASLAGIQMSRLLFTEHSYQKGSEGGAGTVTLSIVEGSPDLEDIKALVGKSDQQTINTMSATGMSLTMSSITVQAPASSNRGAALSRVCIQNVETEIKGVPTLEQAPLMAVITLSSPSPQFSWRLRLLGIGLELPAGGGAAGGARQ